MDHTSLTETFHNKTLQLGHISYMHAPILETHRRTCICLADSYVSKNSSATLKKHHTIISWTLVKQGDAKKGRELGSNVGGMRYNWYTIGKSVEHNFAEECQLD